MPSLRHGSVNEGPRKRRREAGRQCTDPKIMIWIWISGLDPRSQEIIDPSLCFVESSTGIINLTNQFEGRSTEIIDLHFISYIFKHIFKQMMKISSVFLYPGHQFNYNS